MQIAGADLEAGILLATPIDTPTIEHYHFFYGRRPPPAHDVLMKQTSGVGRGPWWPCRQFTQNANLCWFLPSIQSDTMVTDPYFS